MKALDSLNIGFPMPKPGTRLLHRFGGLPFRPDLNLLAEGRSGLTIPASIGSGITITTPTFTAAGTRSVKGDKTNVLERALDGNSHTIYIKIKQIAAISATQNVLSFGRNMSGYTRGIVVLTTTTDWYTSISSGTSPNLREEVLLNNPNDNFLPHGWVDVLIQVNQETKKLIVQYRKESDGTVIGSDMDYDISGWTFTAADNEYDYELKSAFFAYADLKKFNGIKTLAQCKDQEYTTDLELWYPTIVDGTDVSGNDHHLSTYQDYVNRLDSSYYSDISTYMLDYGYSLYRSPYKAKYFTEAGTDRFHDVYVPHTPAGVPIARTMTDSNTGTYVLIETHAGNLTKHNMAECRLNIPATQWDKSDTNAFEDIIRTSVFYDAANPDEWHLSELDYLIYSQRCKTDYKGLNFFKISDDSFVNRNFLDQIFCYDTNKTGNSLNRVLSYTRDKQAMDAAMNFYCDASDNQYVALILQGISDASSPVIYWGDGERYEGIIMNGTDRTITYTYGGTSNYPVYIFNPQNLLKYYAGTANTFMPVDNDIAEFNKAINLTYLQLWGQTVKLVGDASGLSKSLERLQLDGETMTGDMTLFINMVYIWCYATFSGNMSLALNLEVVNFCWHGLTSISIDITNMPNITDIDVQDTPHFRISGDLTNKTSFRQLCYGGVGAYHKLYGDISTCVNLEYWALVESESYCHGSVSALTKLWLLRQTNTLCTFTGNFDNLVLLQAHQEYGSLSEYTKPATLAHLPKLCMLHNTDWIYSEAEVNQYLADLWANRDVARSYATREIHLDIGASAAPTGQGVTDKAALEAYRSPNDDPANDLWTIETN